MRKAAIDVGQWTSYSVPVTCPLTGAHWVVTKRYREFHALHTTLEEIHTKAPASIQRLLQRPLEIAFPDKETFSRLLLLGGETFSMRQRRQRAFLLLMDALMHVRAIAREHRSIVQGNLLFLALDEFVAQPSVARARMFDADNAEHFRVQPPSPHPLRDATDVTDVYTLSVTSLDASTSWTVEKRYAECWDFREALLDMAQQIKTQPSLMHLSWLVKNVAALPFPLRRWRSDTAAVIRDRQEGLQRLVTAVMTLAWFCRHRSAVPAANAPLATAMGDVLAHIEAFLPPPPPRVSESDIDCVICWDPFTDDYADVHTLACGHRFHRPCFTEWVAQRPICPVCCRTVAVDGIDGQAPPVVYRPPRHRRDLWLFWEAFVVVMVATVGAAAVGFYFSPVLLALVDRCLHL
ncbi:Aste57867_9052 [Aphanomyces stellatus]|uniref:Aste57867_9052 protein n=1 Tax=Aphanomyces stellatus TaxID=120398 RepID=A0A485KLU3_9STRA|nr:hypothetical protein As57867_009016 [Aphanomyces stellatus]VFT85936.1 Aste57867_9052 [Aphanomyces stellatus]